MFYVCLYCVAIVADGPMRVRVGTSLASQPYFSAYAHARAKVGGGREGKIHLGRPARFL